MNTIAKKLTRIFLPALSVLVLSGCFQVEDELTIEKDGSGTVNLTVSSKLPDELIENMGMAGGFGQGNSPIYPPINEAEARRFFPSKDFTLKVEESKKDGGQTVTVHAAFKDVNAMLASPYGKAHQLLLSTNESGILGFQALTGGSPIAQAAQFKAEGEMTPFELPGMDEAQKHKDELRFTFRVNLPNVVNDANGTKEKNSAAWTVERAKFKSDEEFAAKAGELLQARCSLAGVMFTPNPQVRLGLFAFSQLKPGMVSSVAALPDTNKIAAATRFVPCVLNVNRTLDLSGESSGMPSQAVLTGAILVPPEFAPQRWGTAKLLDAIDAKGNSLLPKEETDRMMGGFSHHVYTGDRADTDDDGATDTDTDKSTAEKPHLVTLQFKAPEWKVKKISRIKGAVEMQYLGGSEIIKLTNAVPASSIMDMSKGSSVSRSSESERGLINDARLAQLGLKLRVQMAMVQSGMTTISLEIGSGNAALMDAQVFDAEGRPWPTTLMSESSEGEETRSCTLMVSGKPKAPLSMAVAVGGVGASVTVPILVENVSVEGK